jgi:hypothetical protein
MCETDRQTDIDVVGSNSSYVRHTDRDRDLLCSQQFLRARERDDREFASVLMVLSGFHEAKELLYV